MAGTPFMGKATMRSVSIRVSMTDKFKEASPNYTSECTNNPSRTPADSQNSAPQNISQTTMEFPGKVGLVTVQVIPLKVQ